MCTSPSLPLFPSVIWRFILPLFWTNVRFCCHGEVQPWKKVSPCGPRVEGSCSSQIHAVFCFRSGAHVPSRLCHLSVISISSFTQIPFLFGCGNCVVRIIHFFKDMGIPSIINWSVDLRFWSIDYFLKPIYWLTSCPNPQNDSCYNPGRLKNQQIFHMFNYSVQFESLA